VPISVSLAIGPSITALLGRARGLTKLLRQPNGTVLVTHLGPTWSPILTRQPNGNVIVTGA
jgi:hypothetical protein